MKTPSRKLILYYTLFATVAGLLLAALRTAVSYTSLESGIELYKYGSPLDDILHIAIAVCSLLLLTLFFLPLGEEDGGAGRRVSTFTVFAASFSGFMILAYDFILIYELAAAKWSALNLLLGKMPVGEDTVASAIFLLCLILSAFPAAICFFKIAASGISDSGSFALLVPFPVIWQVLLTLHVYFDTTTAMNSPIKVLRIIALLSLVMFSMQEARFILKLAQPRWYFFFGCLSLLIGITVTLSDAILFGMGIISLSEGYLLIALNGSYVIYIASRMFSHATAKPRKVSPQST